MTKLLQTRQNKRVLIDEGMGQVGVGVSGASHHLAQVVDAGGYGGDISWESLKVCEDAVLPKRGISDYATRVDED